MRILTLIFLILILALPKKAFADWIPDTPKKVDQLADAIYWAEGGKNTNFPYGIKSVGCDNEDECRRICKNTIRNNIIRHKRKSMAAPIMAQQTYLEFLQSRYCPTSGNLTASEEALNGHWLKNVKWFLNHPKEIL